MNSHTCTCTRHLSTTVIRQRWRWSGCTLIISEFKESLLACCCRCSSCATLPKLESGGGGGSGWSICQYKSTWQTCSVRRINYLFEEFSKKQSWRFCPISVGPFIDSHVALLLNSFLLFAHSSYFTILLEFPHEQQQNIIMGLFDCLVWSKSCCVWAKQAVELRRQQLSHRDQHAWHSCHITQHPSIYLSASLSLSLSPLFSSPHFDLVAWIWILNDQPGSAPWPLWPLHISLLAN